MQSTTSQKPTESEFWWPSPASFDDLLVEFENQEDGSAIIHLMAPDGTECAAWLAYHNETPERQEAFQSEFMKAIKEQIDRKTDG